MFNDISYYLNWIDEDQIKYNAYINNYQRQMLAEQMLCIDSWYRGLYVDIKELYE